MSPAGYYRELNLRGISRRRALSPSVLTSLLVLGGPLVGMGLAFLVEASGEVLPTDRLDNLLMFVVATSIAGIIASISFALSVAQVEKSSKLHESGPIPRNVSQLGTAKIRFDQDDRVTSPHAPSDSVSTLAKP